MTIKRPLTVTWLALGVLSIAVLYVVRFVEIILTWQYLLTLPMSVSVIYLALTALIWSVTWLAIFSGVWNGKLWASRKLKIATGVFTIYYWVDKIYLFINPSKNVNDGFQIVMTVLLINIVFWILTRYQTRIFFGELNEQ